tara:strand:- start:1166 stop:1429 length:264 start_codon:yes stop_codon:yes gene_type:complete
MISLSFSFLNLIRFCCGNSSVINYQWVYADKTVLVNENYVFVKLNQLVFNNNAPFLPTPSPFFVHIPNMGFFWAVFGLKRVIYYQIY